MDVNARLEPAFPVAKSLRSTHSFTHPTALCDRDPELTV